jgi:hypothetical protein
MVLIKYDDDDYDNDNDDDDDFNTVVIVIVIVIVVIVTTSVPDVPSLPYHVLCHACILANVKGRG